MSNDTTITLKNVGVFLGIVLALASVVGAAFITYDNVKEAKIDVDKLKTDMQIMKTQQARFEGIIDERTRNTGKRVDEIYNIIKDWGPVNGK